MIQIFLLIHTHVHARTHTGTMKKNILVLAFDIEMSGATLRRFDRPLAKPDGDIIGIGGSLVQYNEETKSCEEIDRLFIPMLCVGKFKTSDKVVESKCILVNYADEGKVRAVTLDDQEQDPEICVDMVETGRTTVFEQRCWEEFWSKHPTILKQLVSKGEDLTFLGDYEIARTKLIAFRLKGEIRATEMEHKLVIVSDNVSYDIGMLEKMMEPRKVLPFVYRLTDEKYNGGTPCTHSMQKGLLAAVDPIWLFGDKDVRRGDTEWISWLEESDPTKVEWWSMTKRIRYLYHIPKPEVEHDHNPANDAFTIACEYLNIHAIGLGHYELDSSRTISLPGPGKRKRDKDQCSE